MENFEKNSNHPAKASEEEILVTKKAPAASSGENNPPASRPNPVRRAARTVPTKAAPAPAPVETSAPLLPGILEKSEGKSAPKKDGAPKGKEEKPKRAHRERDARPVVIQDRGGVIVSVLKALIYIAVVLVISGFLAIYGIRMANDIFAFVKDDMSVEITLEADATLEEVSQKLYDEGLIENADWFRLYTQFKYRDRDLKFVSGTYTLNSTMNYNTFISSLTPRSGRVIRSILIPEGYTVDQIIDLLVSEGIGTREGYVNAIQNYDYNYEFLDLLDSIELKAGRKYRLEGYLFPAKYDFYQDSGEIAVIDKMLAAFQANFSDEYYDRLTELDMNMDEIITLASIIEREAQFSSDMYYISGVFHNRLDNPAAFPYLGSDATVQYALPEHKAELTREDLEIDSPYNTHKNPGLTPGAICNPGMDAVTAALYPEDKLMETRGVKSYYFVAGADGYSLFGANENEHLNNIAKVAADKKAAESR